MAGLTNDKLAGRPINAGDDVSRPRTMRTCYVRRRFIGGLGDMPKSGFSANSQAKVAAMAVRGALTDSKVFPAKFSNTCWSLIAENDGVKVGASYEATPEKIAKVDGFISQNGEEAALRKQTFEESIGWYEGITADMFG